MSARLAWETIREVSGTRAHLFSYRPIDGVDSQPQYARRITATSRWKAVLAAIRSEWRPQIALVWHLHLLKVLPFFRARDLRTIVFLHGIESWKPLDKLSTVLLRKADLILSNSDHTWQRFISCNPSFKDSSHRTVALGVGAPIQISVPQPQAPPVALMVGRAERAEDYKGHRNLISAWPSVEKRTRGAQLWIVGDGTLLPELRDMVRRRGLAQQVRFWGQVSNTEKTDLLVRSRCLALPSRNEGFGLVYLEAMRLGRPCLVGIEDAGPEVVQPPVAGLAVDPGDKQGLAKALSRLLTSDDQWQMLSNQARKRYECHFTGDRFKSRLAAELLGRERTVLETTRGFEERSPAQV